MLSTPARAIKCDWIEVYLPNANNPPTIDHHDKVSFWKDEYGDLVITGSSVLEQNTSLIMLNITLAILIMHDKRG